MPIIIVLLMMVSPAWAHQLIPMRIEAPSGTQVTISQFTLRNRFKQQDRFSMSCYKVTPKGDRQLECVAVPSTIILSPNAQRKVKVKLDTPEDGLYHICSTEEPDENEYKAVVTRICATLGVGVNPNTGTSKRPKYRTTANELAAGK